MIGDAMDWTPQMALDEARTIVESEDPPTGMVISFVWQDHGNRYDRRYLNVGLSCSQMVALLECQKHVILRELNGPQKEEWE